MTSEIYPASLEEPSTLKTGMLHKRVQVFIPFKFSVNKASSCSAVQEGLDRVEFACVCGSNLYQQEQGSLLCVQGAN